MLILIYLVTIIIISYYCSTLLLPLLSLLSQFDYQAVLAFFKKEVLYIYKAIN